MLTPPGMEHFRVAIDWEGRRWNKEEEYHARRNEERRVSLPFFLRKKTKKQQTPTSEETRKLNQRVASTFLTSHFSLFSSPRTNRPRASTPFEASDDDRDEEMGGGEGNGEGETPSLLLPQPAPPRQRRHCGADSSSQASPSSPRWSASEEAPPGTAPRTTAATARTASGIGRRKNHRRRCLLRICCFRGKSERKKKNFLKTKSDSTPQTLF